MRADGQHRSDQAAARGLVESMQADGQHRSDQAAARGLVESVQADALIIGGGPAGSTLASALSAQGWQTILMDKARFPRGKVCGEFLSPAIWPFFKSLGIDQKLLELQGSRINRAHFISPDGKEIQVPLPPAPGRDDFHGYGLSRNRLDEFLLSQAEARGCRVFQNCEVREIRKTEKEFLASGFDFTGKKDFSIQASIVINAAGRFNRWQELVKKPSLQERKICFKAHFRADGPGRFNQAAARGPDESVRMIIFRGGYLGLMPIEDGQINVCGTVNEKILKMAGFDFDRLLGRVAEEQPSLKVWLEKARRLNDWLSCGPQTHQFNAGFRDGLFYLGDAACSLEPFMGQGMTAALAGASLLAKLLGRSRPESKAFNRIGQDYQRKVKRMYRSKMVLGNLLNLITGRFDNNSGWKNRLLFNPLLIRYGVGKTCEIPFSGYQNTWRGDDAPQSPTSTAPEQAEILR